MTEIAVIDKEEIVEVISKIEKLHELYNSETNSDNAIHKKSISLDLSKIAKTLDLKRQDYVMPALEEQRRINGFFKPVIDRLDAMSKGFIKQVNDFVQLEAKRERERQAQIAKEEAEKLLSGQKLDPKPEPIRPVSPNVTVSTQTVWIYEVADLSKVPREYLDIDTVKVNQAIKAGVRDIPGLKIRSEERVTRR
jgi:hypothetical protein